MTYACASARLFAACLVFASLGAQAFQLRGFRGLEWGEEAERLGATAQRVSQHAGLTCYERANENLLFGDVTLKSVRYCFRRDRFHSVTLEAAADAKMLEAEFERSYGQPDTRSAQKSTWGRKASDSHAEVVALGHHSRLTLLARKGEAMAAAAAGR